MNWKENGNTNGKAWVHPLLLDSSLRLTVLLPPLSSLRGTHLRVCASALILPFFCRAWPIQSSPVQGVLFISTFPWKLSLEPMFLLSTDRLVLSVKMSFILRGHFYWFPMILFWERKRGAVYEQISLENVELKVKVCVCVCWYIRAFSKLFCFVNLPIGRHSVQVYL